MFVINVPATCNYDGAQGIIMPLQFICSDRYYSTTSGTVVVNKSYPEGTSLSTALYDLQTALGFNFFSAVTRYIANATDDIDDMSWYIKAIIGASNLAYQYMPRNNTSSNFTNFKVSDHAGDYSRSTAPGDILAGGQLIYFYTPNSNEIVIDDRYGTIEFTIDIYPERMYEYGEFNTNMNHTFVTGRITYDKPDLGTYSIEPRSLKLTVGNHYPISNTSNSVIPNIINNIDEDTQIIVENPNNPYDDGSSSGSGGGDGSYADADTTTIEKVGIPDPPNISALTSGLITTYAPTLAQVQALGNFLWSSAFDIDSWKKIFAEPINAIIGLGIVPVSPSIGGTKVVKLGDVDTGVSMPYVSTQFIQKSMGSVAIKKEVGCFLDYTDTNIAIYLPYCGMHQLNTEDVMGDTVTVTYNIDVLTGGIAAIISTANKGVVYQFTGNCLANVPLTSISYSQAIQNAVSAGISIGGAALGAATGSMPMTAMGAAGLAKSASNVVMNKHGAVGRSGRMGGAAGLMSVQRPFIIVTRPRKSVPKNLNKYTGYNYNATMNLKNAVGFTMVDQIRLDSIPCMEDERTELYNLLQEGVIF